MNNMLTTEQLQTIACARSRTAAQDVIVPRLLYSVRHGKVATFHPSAMMIETKRERLSIQAITGNTQTVCIRVAWAGEIVFTGLFYPSTLLPLTGQIKICKWRRGADVSIWQAKLFELFPKVPLAHRRRSKATMAAATAFLQAMIAE